MIVIEIDGRVRDMMWTRIELKTRAKMLIRQNYWKNVIAALILSFITGSALSSASSRASNASNENTSIDITGITPGIVFAGISAVSGILLIMLAVHLLLSYFLWGPLEVGARKYFIDCENGNADLKSIFQMVTVGNNTMRTTMLLKDVFCVLWGVLFIIPGIIKSYEYRMIPYLLAEYPGMDRKEVFAESKRMMDGNKWDAFVLDLSFIGWHLLGAITLGIAEVLYVSPYTYLTDAELYRVLKIRA